MSGGMGAGKRFEAKFRAAASRRAWVLRIPDSVRWVNGHAVGEETEADFIVATGEETCLVECKATNRPRLDFRNVKPHQERALAAFDALGPRCRGLLAVEFYDPDSYRRGHRMFLLPIGEWLRYKAESGRKSMPLAAFEELALEVPRDGAGYDIGGRWAR